MPPVDAVPCSWRILKCSSWPPSWCLQEWALPPSPCGGTARHPSLSAGLSRAALRRGRVTWGPPATAAPPPLSPPPTALPHHCTLSRLCLCQCLCRCLIGHPSRGWPALRVSRRRRRRGQSEGEGRHGRGYLRGRERQGGMSGRFRHETHEEQNMASPCRRWTEGTRA